jgi:hypothetical protein
MRTYPTITANDVARAEDCVRRCRKAWEHYGFRRVTQPELDEAKAQVSRCDRHLEQLESRAWMVMPLKLGLYWIIDRTGLAACGWPVGALIVGAASVVLSAVPLVLLFGDLVRIFVGFGLLFLLTSSTATAVLILLSEQDLGQVVRELQCRLRDRRQRIAELQRRREEWRLYIAELHRAVDAQAAYEDAQVACQKAHAAYARLLELLRSRRYQLAQRDWRSLRGVAFEDFIAEIFEELGFTVEKTKTTGDQGVDLIVSGRGRLIAVQTKGYEGNVGNKAIQEVYAGMAYYRCRECVAITNSGFTTGAVDLARSVRCHLIDGSGIPRLIEGELW